VDAEATDDVDKVGVESDCYVIAVKDDALEDVIRVLCPRIDQSAVCGQKKLFLHTAGSVSMDIFKGKAQRYGVFYPMQTFSKGRMVDFREIPIFVEAADPQSLGKTEMLAKSISNHVIRFSSEQRRHLHLAAVFACNFANHCFTLADDILQEQGLDVSVMLPLVRETVEKLKEDSPLNNQTGPAARNDQQVMAAQEALLSSRPMAQDVYRLMSKSIRQHLTNAGTTRP